MLQSIFIAVMLYHIIKAIIRYAKKKSGTANPAVDSEVDIVSSANFLHPSSEELLNALKNLFGNKPRINRTLDLLRGGLALRDLFLSAVFGIGSLLLFGLLFIMLTVDTVNIADEWIIIVMIGLLAALSGWMAVTYWREARTIEPGAPITGTDTVHHAAHKPHPPIITQNSRTKQFEQL